MTIDGVDRFPGVRLRHAVVELSSAGSIRHLVMDIHTSGEPPNERDRHVIADVTNDSVHIVKTDGAGTIRRGFKTGGGIIVAHVPQMYSLYEIYFSAALKNNATSKSATDIPVHMKQFYIDREFDKFPLGDILIRPVPGGKAEITHDRPAGIGEAKMDSDYRMLTYSGVRSTYKVEAVRLALAPDIKVIAERFEALETKAGPVRHLSVRDTVQAQIGNVNFTVEYSRPLLRGRKLLGDILPYERVWRTGANAATQFTVSAPIKLAGIPVPAGKYTLWTLPHLTGADLILNRQTGQWGTEYDESRNPGIAGMDTSTVTTPIEEFTISVIPRDARKGALVIEWGSFKWNAAFETL